MTKNNSLFFPFAADLVNFNQNWDLHAHTYFGDGRNSVNEMIISAESKRIKKFALTEHVRGSSLSWWDDYVDQIKKKRQQMQLQVLIGIEANAIGEAGNVDVPAPVWEDVEIALGSVHGYYVDETWEKIDAVTLLREDAIKYELEKIIGLCSNRFINVIAHPFWLYSKIHGKVPSEILQEVFHEAKVTDTAVEISLYYLDNPRKTIELLLDENPMVSFGSNAHSIDEIKNILPDIQKYL